MFLVVRSCFILWWTRCPTLSQKTPDLITFFLCRTMLNFLTPFQWATYWNLWDSFCKNLCDFRGTQCPSSLGPKKHPSSGNRSQQGSHHSGVVWNWLLPRCVAVSGSDPTMLAVSSPHPLPPHTALPPHTGSQDLSKSYLKSNLTELSSGIFAEGTELLAWDVQKCSGLRGESLLLLNSIAFLPAASLVLQQLSSYYILPLTSVATWNVKPIISDF